MKTHEMMNRRNEEAKDGTPNYDPMPQMAGGGLIDDMDNFSVGTGDSDTIKGVPLNPETVPEPKIVPEAAPAPMPAVAANPIPVTPKAPQGRLPGMPPDVTADELQKYLGKQRAGLEQFGPEQQMAMQNSMNQARTGLGPSLANAGAGFADALMQGVARAGNPGFQEKLQNQQNQLAGETLGTMEKAQGGKMAELGAEMKLSQEDPNSPLSKVAQQTEGPTLMQLGASKEQVAKMPASLIGDLLGKKITLEEALARIAETGAYQRGMVGLKGQEINQKKNEFEAQHPILTAMQRVSGGGDSGTPPKPFSSVQEAESAGLPPGTRVSINGRMATIQ